MTTTDKTIRRTISQRSELIHDLHQYGINPDAREIWLHSYLEGSAEEYGEPGVEYRMATIFEKNLNLLTSVKKATILVRMHVTGGMWEDGMAVYDSISLCDCWVNIIAYGHATSMSSVILQAADTRVLMPHTHVMVHMGHEGISDSVPSFISWAGWAEKTTDIMIDIYAKRCVKGPFFQSKNYSMKRVKAYIKRKMEAKQDWIMDAEEAIDFGFADGVYGEEKFTLEDLQK